MTEGQQMVKEVYEAKQDPRKADDLIRRYIPFIRAEASKVISRLCTEQDDEYSIAMIAFHEAIVGYEKSRGAFLGYAAMLIRSRIIDYLRKEARHQGHLSLYEERGEDGRTLMDTLADGKDHMDDLVQREATLQEISELAAVMETFGVSFSDVADNCPKQSRTLAACAQVVRYGGENPHLLEELLKTKRLPLAQLAAGTGVERKTLERHRKYILVMLLIQTNGYEIIRGHIVHVLKKGGASV